MDETNLIIDAQKGDLESFNRLVLAYQDIVYTQAFRLMGEFAAAEDTTQEAFISAYRSIRSYRGGSFKAWLLRIVTNACYDELRRRQRRPTTPLERQDSEGEEIDSGVWLADHEASPEEAVQRTELCYAIQHCLDDLPIEFRSVAILVDVQGMDYLEASKVTGIPVGTVKSRLSRARERLRHCLQGFWELLPARFRLVGEELQ
jgi:RNA polymerase sigma-70 factor (ECF subfamily)